MTLEKLKKFLRETSNLLFSSKIYLEDFEYIHSWRKRDEKLFFTYGYFWSRIYHSIGLILVIDICKLFLEREENSLRKILTKLLALPLDSDINYFLDRGRITALNEKLLTEEVNCLLKKINTTRDKYYAHIDQSRSPFEEISVTGKEFRKLLAVAEEIIREINISIEGKDISFESTKGELGHRIFERLEEWENYREKHGRIKLDESEPF